MEFDDDLIEMLCSFGIGSLLGFVLLIAVVSSGCSSTPVCVPTVEIQEVLVETKCVVPIDEVQCEPHEEAPPFDEANKKEWALEFEAVHSRNRARDAACIEALQAQLRAHNELEPKCD